MLLYQVVIHVFHHHAVQILNVVPLAVRPLVHVYLTTLDVHQIAVRNAQLVPNVRLIWPVLMKNVVIHVLEHVVYIPRASFLITTPFVNVCQDIRVIHSLVVQNSHNVRHLKIIFILHFILCTLIQITYTYYTILFNIYFL